MGRRASQQNTYTKGEADPDLSERNDLEQYYDSLAAAPNCVFHPQGGFSDRGGLRLCSDADVLASGAERRLRQRIVPIYLTTANITAANGGTAANLVDENAATVFTTNAVTGAVFTLFEVDLLVAQRVDMVDLVGFSSELLGADEVIGVEYYDGVWQPFGDAVGLPTRKAIRTTARTRRFATTPGGPGGVPVVARHLRLIARDAIGVGQVSIKGVRLWREVAAVTPVDVIEVTRQDDLSYELVITERNVDVFQQQRYCASIPLAVAGQQIRQLWKTGAFDTLFLFHEMLETPRILRQGSAAEWNVEAIGFANMPTLVSAAIFSGDQDEIQDLTLTGIVAGDVVRLMLGDQCTAPFTFSTTSALADQVATAIGALPGITGAAMAVTLLDAAGPTVRIRFAGANGNRSWPLVSALSEALAVVSSTTVAQQGLDASGTYVSAATGWPRCGVLVQQRLMVAGFRAAPTSYRFSTNPDYFDFASTGSPLTADKGFGGALDASKIEVINGLFVGRHLQIFTAASEWYSSARSLDATAPAAFERTSENGSERGVPIVFVDGATIFTQTGGQTLRDYVYVDSQASTSYSADPLTVLAPHLLTGIVDVAHRNARSVRDGNLVVMVNADGTAAALTLLRSQKVIAGSPWTTYGAFRSAMVSSRHDLYVVTERAGALWLEKWTAELPLDWATESVGAARTTITGAGYLDGRSDVWAIADGEVLGPLTVAGDTLTLEIAAETVIFGLLPAWGPIRSQVLKEKVANAQPFRGPARIYELGISVKSTGDLWVGANGQAHRQVPVLRFGDRMERGGPLQTVDGGAPGLPLYERLYTGDLVVDGLNGFSDHPYWELSRRVPAPVHVKGVRLEVVHKGD